MRTAGALLAVLIGLASCSRGVEYRSFPDTSGQRWMQVGDTRLELEVAASREAREQGLMYRSSMPEDHGMLFVYPAPRVLRFWMKNTFIPLSIAFIGQDGTIVNIEDMQPLVEVPGASSLEAVRYALEVNQGWFERHGVRTGDRLEMPPWLEEITAEGDVSRS